MLGVQGTSGEGAPISREAKWRSVFDEKSEDGVVPKAWAT